MNITADELLAAIVAKTASLAPCPECSGSGTRFGPTGKSSVCKRCDGKRKIVVVPRFPAEVPYSAYWQRYFDIWDRPGP